METDAQYFDCLCRTCMNKVEASSHDGNSKPQQQWLSILDIIEECGDLRIAELLSEAVPQIVVQPNDELPKQICSECLQQLLSVYRFQQICVQSDKQMHELLSKEHTILKAPILKEVIKGETETNDADSHPLKDLPCSSTLQNLQQPSIQESLAEVIVPTIDPEAAESSAADHLQDDNQTLEHWNDSQGVFGKFIKSEPLEDEANSEYSDGDTMHSTNSVNRDESIELEDEQVNANSSRHNCHLCNKTYKRRAYLARHLNNHKKKANNLKEYCYACHLCSESYKERRYLTKHLNLAHYSRRSHKSKEKPHKCDLCEKRYTRNHELKVHRRKHTGERPYKCKYCASAFTSCGALTRHLSTHENEDPETRERNLKALQEEDKRQSKEEQQQQKLSNKELEQPSTVPDEFTEFNQDETIEHDKSNTEYSDGNTMHSTMPVMKGEPTKELEEEQVNDVSSHKQENCHACHLCRKAYKERRFLAKHLMQKHSIKLNLNTCEFCNKNFKAPAFLRRHMRTHTGERPYTCSDCGKSFNQEGILAQHRSIHTGNKPYECPYCQKRFSLRSILKRHSTIHEEAKGHELLIESEDQQVNVTRNEFSVFVINELIEDDKSKTEHSDGGVMHLAISVKKDEELPIEPEDQQVNVTQNEFREFVKNEPIEDDGANTENSDADTMQSTISVTKEKPTEPKDEQVNVTSALHECHLCKKSFKKKSNLRRHLNFHKRKANSEEYCHACHLCSNTYTEEGYLTKHLLLAHSIEPQLTCNICNKSFKTPVHLRRHIRTHTDKRPYSCSECGKSFHQQYILTQHRKTHFPVKRHECSHCQQRFSFKSILMRHIATHEEIRVHECDICRKRFKTKFDLTNHTKYHTGEKPYKCDICGQQFYSNHLLQVHIRTHTGEKPYQCKCCERGFISSTLLNQHLRTHLGKNIYRCEFCPLAFPSTVERRVHLHSHDNDDPETRERNLRALQEEEAKLKYSNKESEESSTEEQQQQDIEQPSTDQAEFTEFIQNETIEDEKSNTQYSYGGTMHSTISMKKDETSPIEPDDQQVNATRDEFSVFFINEHIEDENPNTEYSDGDTMHSTMPKMKDEPTTEPEDEEVNDASSHRHVDHEANGEENCHVCHLCSKSYTDEWILTRHLRKEHSIDLKGHTCEFCNKNFKAPELLRRHIHIHTGERPYSCSDCGKTFNQPGSLGRHRYIHTSDKPHECPYCPLRFSTKVGVERHKLKHEGVKEHDCDICGKSFTLKSDLRVHKLIHNEDKAHKCDICGQQFVLFNQLKIHIRKHTGEKPYKCKYCERAFISSSILSKHLRTHLGKNIYRCELCPLAFPLHSELRVHLTTHENEDPETREQNLKALQEEEAKLKLKCSKKETEKSSTEQPSVE